MHQHLSYQNKAHKYPSPSCQIKKKKKTGIQCFFFKKKIDKLLQQCFIFMNVTNYFIFFINKIFNQDPKEINTNLLLQNFEKEELHQN